MTKRSLLALVLIACSCTKQIDAVVEEPSKLTFEVSFDDSWNRIHSYKLSDSGRFFYFQMTIDRFDTVNFADTLVGEKVLAASDLDRINLILQKVIADSLGDKDLMCFDCGRGFLVYKEKEYQVSKTSIPELFRIGEFVYPDSLSNRKVDVGSYPTFRKLMSN